MPTGTIPTVALQDVAYAPSSAYDVSIETPDQQFQVLSDIIQADDAANPAPYTATPPWGEPTDPGEYIPISVQEESYMPATDIEPTAETDLLSLVSDAATNDIPEWTWYNDDQYYGLGVPPGVPNYGQPIESGHTQAIVHNPAAELGWDAWSGKFVIARVARHENNFPGYNAGTSRGHMLPVRELQNRNSSTYTQSAMAQYRQNLLAEINRRGIHNVVVADVPSVPYTEQVAVVDPTLMMPEMPIGPEGVLP